MNTPSYTLTNESITIIWEGKPHTVQKGSPQFLSLRLAILNEKWEDIPKNLTVAKSLAEWAKGKFTVRGETIYYDQEQLPSDINRRILQMAGKGEDPTPVFRFWERLQKNPSMRSVEQLWPFLQHQGIPLTEDGFFLAYKGINPDYTDKYTGKIDNKPGVVNEMPRNRISDDPRVECHYGYHVGALSYARTFAPDGRMVICKVDPADVVCVPYDESNRKMRVCKYEVIGNHNGEHLPDTTFIPDDHDEHTYDEDELEDEDCEIEDDEDELDDQDEDCETEDDKQERLGQRVLPLDNPAFLSGVAQNTHDMVKADKAELEKMKISDLMAKEADEGLMPVSVCGWDRYGDGTNLCSLPKGHREHHENDKTVLDGSALAAGDVARLGSGAKESEKTEKRVPSKGFSKFDKMGMEELMNLSIDELRQYATHGLRIIGASKIPGGKVSLVSRILAVRV